MVSIQAMSLVLSAEPDDELEGEAAVDAAQAKLENELEDLGLEVNKNDK